jgi:hypothetical protein
MLTDASCQK